MKLVTLAAFAMVAAAVVLAGAGAALAGAPTPTPTPSPTPTTTPTPVPGSSTITIRFVRDGQPVVVAIAFPVDDVFADGVQCNIPGPLSVEVVEVSEYSTSWPLVFEQTGAAQECTKGPPTVLRFEIGSLDFGTLVAEFVWTGEDIVVDIEVPPSPATPPAQLPGTGAAPSGSASGGDWIAVATGVAVLIAGFLVIAVGWRVRGRARG